MDQAASSYLQEHAPVLALSLDRDLIITSVNAYARRVLGKELVGTPLSAAIVGFSIPADLRALIVAGSGPHRMTLKTTARLLEAFDLHFSDLPDGYLVLGALDAEEQEALRSRLLALTRELSGVARELHQANAGLNELNQLKNRFLGMAAHDLRQPVGAILVYGQFVLDEAGAGLSTEHREFLRTVLRSAAGMKQLIDDFLDVALIESGRLRLNVSAVSIHDILARVGEMGRLMAAARSITLHVEQTAGGRELMLDGPKIEQVLLNLLANAVRHSAPGQSVWLSTACNAETASFVVRDEGCGIAIEDQQRLFAPFERVAEARSPRERHAGLGLTIAKSIVDAHRGSIRVESAPGKGATFVVTLPASPSDVPPTAADCTP
jgi:signal transduction histidine kinase